MQQPPSSCPELHRISKTRWCSSSLPAVFTPYTGSLQIHNTILVNRYFPCNGLQSVCILATRAVGSATAKHLEAAATSNSNTQAFHPDLLAAINYSDAFSPSSNRLVRSSLSYSFDLSVRGKETVKQERRPFASEQGRSPYGNSTCICLERQREDSLLDCGI